MSIRALNLLLFLSILIWCAPLTLLSQSDSIRQDKPAKVLITMSNGETYQGVIIDRPGDKLILRTANGELRLLKDKIASIEPLDYEGPFRFKNPHATRYFFGPSGIPLKKGEGYYQNVLLVGNFANYGISDNISVGGGFEFISTILGYPIWFFTPKVGFDLSPKAHLAGGLLVAGFASEGTASLAYGSFTLGNSESNLSAGVGYGLVDRRFSSEPAIMLAGTHRFSNGFALLSENYLVPGGSFFGIEGFRLFSRQNAFDIGIILIPAISEFIPALPFVGYARTF